MKVIISDTLGYYANYVIPAEKNDCTGLMSALIGRADEDEKFKKRINLATFIFDDIEHYKPKYRPKEDEIYLCKAISQIHSGRINTIPINEEKMEKKFNKKGYDKNSINEIKKVVNKITPNSELINDRWLLTPDPYFSRKQLDSISTLNKQAILSLFATYGIDFVLPSIFIKEDEKIIEFKEKFAEERLDYLLYLDHKADELLSMVNGREASSADLIEYAQRSIAVELKLRADRIESAFQSEGTNAIKYMWSDFKTKIPSIGSNIISGNIIGAAKDFLGSINKGHKASDDITSVLKNYPEAAYLYRIRSRGKA